MVKYQWNSGAIPADVRARRECIDVMYIDMHDGSFVCEYAWPAHIWNADIHNLCPAFAWRFTPKSQQRRAT